MSMLFIFADNGLHGTKLEDLNRLAEIQTALRNKEAFAKMSLLEMWVYTVSVSVSRPKSGRFLVQVERGLCFLQIELKSGELRWAAWNSM